MNEYDFYVVGLSIDRSLFFRCFFPPCYVYRLILLSSHVHQHNIRTSKRKKTTTNTKNVRCQIGQKFNRIVVLRLQTTTNRKNIVRWRGGRFLFLSFNIMKQLYQRQEQRNERERENERVIDSYRTKIMTEGKKKL